jgi:hypothetical protein
VPDTSRGVKQEAAAVSSNRFMYSLDALNLQQTIADEEPLLRDSAEKIDSAQAGGGADGVKKQLAGAIRDSMSGLSRNSIR